MSTEKRSIRFGMSARGAAHIFAEEWQMILGEEGATRLEQTDAMAWSWRAGEGEHGRIRFHDRGADEGAAELEVVRSDGSADVRFAGVLDRLAEALSRSGIDPAVVALDPREGEAPDAGTDPDQPL